MKSADQMLAHYDVRGGRVQLAMDYRDGDRRLPALGQALCATSRVTPVGQSRVNSVDDHCNQPKK